MLRRMATLAQSRLAALARAVRERYRDDEVATHAAALAYQVFLSTLALSLVGLALIGLAEDALPFDLPDGTQEQFANLTRASATLGLVATAALAALEFALFLLAYTVLTPGRLRWRTHLPGAIVMTVGWELFKLAGGVLLEYYVLRARLPYGTIGAIVGLLVYLRLATWLFLFAAELSAALRARRGNARSSGDRHGSRRASASAG
jgi:membrane protein